MAGGGGGDGGGEEGERGPQPAVPGREGEELPPVPTRRHRKVGLSVCLSVCPPVGLSVCLSRHALGGSYPEKLITKTKYIRVVAVVVGLRSGPPHVKHRPVRNAIERNFREKFCSVAGSCLVIISYYMNNVAAIAGLVAHTL